MAREAEEHEEAVVQADREEGMVAADIVAGAAAANCPAKYTIARLLFPRETDGNYRRDGFGRHARLLKDCDTPEDHQPLTLVLFEVAARKCSVEIPPFDSVNLLLKDKALPAKNSIREN